MTKTTDTGNYHTGCSPRILHMFVLQVKVQYTIIIIMYHNMKSIIVLQVNLT